MERPYCEAQTQKKKPCKNKALEGSTLCSVHGGVCTAINALAQKNRPAVIKKIGRRQQLPKTKTPGFVYIFYLKHEKGKNFWKIGKTIQLKKRMQEWNAHYGGKAVVVEKRLYKSDYCEFMERLIHLYLDYCRMHRYPIHTEDGIEFHSVYSATGKVIEDKVEEEERLVAMHKNTEFFHAPLKEIERVIAFIAESFSSNETLLNQED